MGEYSGNLDNSGARIVLASPLGDTILDVSYRDDWQPITDGAGFALVLSDENIATQFSSDSSQWRAGSVVNGTPGRADPLPLVFPRVVVNELLSHPSTGSGDLVELQNLSSVTASIGGWFLTDDFSKPMKYRIPGGVVIDPGGFYLMGSEQFSTNTPQPFGFSALGEAIYLFSGDSATNLTGYVHGFEFGPQREGLSGRYVDSTGQEQFVSQTEKTFAATNSRPAVPSLVFTEIMYHPADIFLNGAFWNDQEDEYIELFNRNDHSILLFDALSQSNAWKISGEVQFIFPTNAVVPAQSYLLLVPFDPITDFAQLEAFQKKYQVVPGSVIFGPYLGHLNNKKGTLELFESDPPILAADGTQTIPDILTERIDYSTDAPWEVGADGFGFSLQRKNSFYSGNGNT